MSAKKQARRSRPRRKNNKRAKKSTNVPDMASLSTKRSMTVGGGQFAVNTLYSLMNTQLSDFPRAETVASQFQFYRIKKIAVTFKPTYDTYSQAGAVSKTNLFYMLDKSGSVPSNITLEGLKQMGARPKQLDEKNLTISWSPSVLESVMYASGGAGVQGLEAARYKISPWLTTQSGIVVPGAFTASAVDHLGLYWYVDQLQAAGGQYAVEVEVQFQFKKPLAPYTVGAPTAIRAELAQINNSPDGIVGGGDGV